MTDDFMNMRLIFSRLLAVLCAVAAVSCWYAPEGEADAGVAAPSWYELPAMDLTADSEGYLVSSSDPSQYFAWHSFNMAGKEYRNYTVCFSAEHHAPVWVAAPRHRMYSRPGVRRTEAYGKDPLIPADLQYRSGRGGGKCNRGHLLTSGDRLCISDANVQVFYYSNIAPQIMEGFNNGEHAGWNILEDFIDKQVCADTLYEVIGVYYEDFTDGYGNRVKPYRLPSYGGRSDVDRPTMFYYAVLRTKSGNTRKALADCSSDELKCAAFLRCNTGRLEDQAVTKAEMMSIAELEKLTDMRFFVNVPQAPKTVCRPSDWGL